MYYHATSLALTPFLILHIPPNLRVCFYLCNSFPSVAPMLCPLLLPLQLCHRIGLCRHLAAMLFKEIYHFHIKRFNDVFFFPQSQVYQQNAQRQGITNLMKPTGTGDMMMVVFIAMLITLPTTSGTVSRERLGQ